MTVYPKVDVDLPVQLNNRLNLMIHATVIIISEILGTVTLILKTAWNIYDCYIHLVGNDANCTITDIVFR